jgi:hypothetical protein
MSKAPDNEQELTAPQKRSTPNRASTFGGARAQLSKRRAVNPEMRSSLASAKSSQAAVVSLVDRTGLPPSSHLHPNETSWSSANMRSGRPLSSCAADSSIRKSSIQYASSPMTIPGLDWRLSNGASVNGDRVKPTLVDSRRRKSLTSAGVPARARTHPRLFVRRAVRCSWARMVAEDSSMGWEDGGN